MDAREKLRLYLEQRRDLGESELLLDSMSVEDALRAIGVIGRGDRPATPRELAADIKGDWRAALGGTIAGSAPPPSTQPIVAEPRAGLSSRTSSDELFNSGIAELDSLDAIADAVIACTRCPLYKTANKGVPGEGAANARLVCVGEGPGATEDETGLPFVGPAGELLTKILAAVDLSREEVFITNVVKHRPPGNRNPAPDEIEACSPYLVRQLDLIKPKVIVAFGTFAAQTLLNTKTPIGKLRGEVHRYHGIPLVVTYHPAALLRNPSWKRPTWEDVKLARRILDSATGA